MQCLFSYNWRNKRHLKRKTLARFSQVNCSGYLFKFVLQNGSIMETTNSDNFSIIKSKLLPPVTYFRIEQPKTEFSKMENLCCFQNNVPRFVGPKANSAYKTPSLFE